MKKFWMFLLLAPILSHSASFPIYDDETGYEVEMNSDGEEVASEKCFEGDSIASDSEAQEDEVLVSPQRRYRGQNSRDLSLEQSASKAKATSPSSLKKPSSSKLKRTPAKKNNRSSIKGNTAARTKMKDARQNSDRPRVTHRGQEQKGSQNVEQVEADSLTEESVFEEQKAPKVRKSPAVAEKKTGQVQSRTTQKKVKGKTYRQSAKKAESKAKSHHFDKCPLSE